jgi:hypothetical protein
MPRIARDPQAAPCRDAPHSEQEGKRGEDQATAGTGRCGTAGGPSAGGGLRAGTGRGAGAGSLVWVGDGRSRTRHSGVRGFSLRLGRSLRARCPSSSWHTFAARLNRTAGGRSRRLGLRRLRRRAGGRGRHLLDGQGSSCRRTDSQGGCPRRRRGTGGSQGGRGGRGDDPDHGCNCPCGLLDERPQHSRRGGYGHGMANDRESRPRGSDRGGGRCGDLSQCGGDGGRGGQSGLLDRCRSVGCGDERSGERLPARRRAWCGNGGAFNDGSQRRGSADAREWQIGAGARGKHKQAPQGQDRDHTSP